MPVQKNSEQKYGDMKAALDYRCDRTLLLRSTKLTELIFLNDIFCHKNNIKEKSNF